MGKGRGWHGNTAGHRRAAIKGLIKAGKRRSMFAGVASKKYGKIVTIRTTMGARESLNKLLVEFGSAQTKAKHRRVAQVTQLAANRARASATNPALSRMRKIQLERIAKIYDKGAATMWGEFRKMYSKEERMK